MREEKHKEFLYPKTDVLKVTELATKFNHLLQYAGQDVSSEEQKIWHFHEWMSPDIKPMMLSHKCSTLEQYVDAAYKLEVTLEESTKRRSSQRPRGRCKINLQQVDLNVLRHCLTLLNLARQKRMGLKEGQHNSRVRARV